MDKQEKEIIGRNWLKNELIKAGIGFATPERDNGIDLIAYNERDYPHFKSIPLQLKTSTNTHFSLDEKYRKISGIKIIFIWYALEPEKTIAYCLKYSEVKKLADKLGWTKTSTWKNNKKYSNNGPGEKIKYLLEPFILDCKTLFN